MAQLQEQHIAAILDGMADTPAAANNLRRMLKAIMKLAKKRKLVSHNPMTEIEPIRYKVKGFTDWSDADIREFSNTYPIRTRERLALELLVCAGPRRSDVIRLGPQHVVDGRLKYRQGKTGAEIDIPVLSDLNAAINSMQLDGNTFLSTQFGKPFTETGFYNWFKDKTLKAGLPKDRSPHGLRKACCRRLAEAGCSPHEIMSVSGHATLKEIDRYTRAANRSRLADSAMTTLSNARNRDEKLPNQPVRLANISHVVSQSKRQTVEHEQLAFWYGGGGVRHLCVR